jgi:salicylate hydroxylase
MAIEDGLVLARCLEQFTPEEALQRYQQARLTRTNTIVTKSAENARRFHNPALAHAEGADDYVSREWQPDRVRERYDWLFNYDAANVAI